MENTDLGEFTTRLEAIAEHYGRKLSEKSARLWWEQLARHSLHEVLKVLGRHLTDAESGERMPSIARILAMLAEQHREQIGADGYRHCEYAEGNLRCRYPGAISDSTTGGGPFWCRTHSKARGNTLAWQALHASQAYRVAASGELVMQYASPQEQIRTEKLTWLEKNLPPLPGESVHDYAMRCREKARGLAIGAGARKDPIKWAHDVLELEPQGRYRGGSAGVEMARKALGIRASEPSTMREPGEDDNEEEAA